MENHTLWSLIREAHQAIAPVYHPAIDSFCLETGLERPDAYWLLAALTFMPTPVSPERLQMRGPYTSASNYHAHLARLAAKGRLDEVEHGEYQLSIQGQFEIVRLVREIRLAIAAADPLPQKEGQHLAFLLEKLVLSSLDAQEPPGHWSISLAYKLMPPATPPLPFAEQAMSCLDGYRDDSHLAAWQAHDLSAPALESLTLLWKKEADNLQMLGAQLSRRGHPLQVYRDALQELQDAGYITGGADAPAITKAGIKLRDNIEQDTNNFFFSPWDCLSEAEKTDLASALEQLREGLTARSPAVPP